MEALITDTLPDLDPCILSYITGMLDDETTTAEFESSEDLFEAVGPFMLNGAPDVKEGKVITLCNALFETIHRPTSNTPTQVLFAPVNISNMSLADESLTSASIWKASKGDNISYVDKTALKKAEQKSKEKSEKKAIREATKAATPKTVEANEGTVQQSINKKDQNNSAKCDIHINNFDLMYGEKKLLLDASLTINYGHRYGLVGRNGYGKSTLMNAIAKRELAVPGAVSILHVEQEVEGTDTQAIASVLECNEELCSLREKEKHLNATLQSNPDDEASAKQLSDVFSQLIEMEADRMESQAATILSGLGFTTHMQQMKTREFSGGWRMRLALARALFTKPDLLLLDEPTNMLDIKAIIWLEQYLLTWPTTLLVISHDFSFLDTVVNMIFHLHSQKIDTYKGDFQSFLKTKEDKLKNQQSEYEAQQAERAHIQAFIDRFRVNANRAAVVQSKIKMLERMPVLRAVVPEKEIVFKFPVVDAKLSPPILQLENVTFHYNKDIPMFKKLDMSVDMESRVCLVGENGAGKSTLLKLLVGLHDPIDGYRNCHRNLKIGYFSQHFVDQLVMSDSPVSLMAGRFPGNDVEQYRRMLGRFGISGEIAMRAISTLSGGQKSRVAFAVLCASEPNFIVLDEPTNHLDMETIEALGHAINNYNGGIVMVSHDERLISKVCKLLWHCHDHTVTEVGGGIQQYRQLMEQELRDK